MNLSTSYHYIGTGELGRMYTLRHYVMHCVPYEYPQVADTYVCNLSTDPKEAVAKAREMTSDLNLAIGIPTLGKIVRSAPRSPEEMEAIRIAEEARIVRQAKEVLAAQASLIAEHPIVGELLALSSEGIADVRGSDFLRSLAEQVARKGTLSERQIDALPSALGRYRDALEAIPETPLTEGRQALSGTIVSFKEVESAYGWTLKMLIRLDDGNKVFGTCPRGIDDADCGDRVQFTATIQRSKNDPHFGFYSRPAKAAKAQS